MGECVISKFNGILDDDTLLKNGEMSFSIQEVSSPNYRQNRYIYIEGHEDAELTIVSENAYFTNSDGSSDLGKTATISKNGGYAYVSNHNAVIKVGNKHDMFNLEVGADIYCDVSLINYFAAVNENNHTVGIKLSSQSNSGRIDFSSINNILYFYGFGNISGDISGAVFRSGVQKAGGLSIKDTNIYGTLSISSDILGSLVITGTKIALNINTLTDPKFSTISVGTPYVTGNLNTFIDTYTALHDLGQINIINSQVTGTLEHVVEKLWSLGKRSGNFMFINNNLVTINGNVNQNTFYCVFGNDGATIHLSSVSGDIIANYDGNVWSY